MENGKKITARDLAVLQGRSIPTLCRAWNGSPVFSGRRFDQSAELTGDEIAALGGLERKPERARAGVATKPNGIATRAVSKETISAAQLQGLQSRLKDAIASEESAMGKEAVAMKKLADAISEGERVKLKLQRMETQLQGLQAEKTQREAAEMSERFKLNLSSGTNLFSMLLMIFSATNILGWFGFLLSSFSSVLQFRIIWNMQRRSASAETRFVGLLGYLVIEVAAYFIHVINARQLIAYLKARMPDGTELPASVSDLSFYATIFIIFISLLAMVNQWNESTD